MELIKCNEKTLRVRVKAVIVLTFLGMVANGCAVNPKFNEKQLDELREEIEELREKVSVHNSASAPVTEDFERLRGATIDGAIVKTMTRSCRSDDDCMYNEICAGIDKENNAPGFCGISELLIGVFYDENGCEIAENVKAFKDANERINKAKGK